MIASAKALKAERSPSRKPQSTLLVFSDDWGRHPSSCQHLVKRLLGRHDVIWVNTIGMRPPRLDRQTIRRAAGKFREWVRRTPATDARTSECAPAILNPRMWPWIRRGWEQRLNDRLLIRQLTRVLSAASGPVAAVTTIPIVGNLIGSLPVDHWTYYCVDDFACWPGLDGEAIRRYEQKLFDRSDVVIAASQVLADLAKQYGRRATLLTHGVDLDHWKLRRPDSSRLDSSPSKCEILFFGLIDERLDTDWLKKLDRDLESGNVTLLGPCQKAPVLIGTDKTRLSPPVSYDLLPARAAAADVLVMPYVDADVTRAMQPLKLLEYLATDKPVVVRDLPANRQWADAMDIAVTPEQFSELVRLRLRTGLPESQRIARVRLKQESWEAKAAVWEQMVLPGAAPAERFART